MCRLPIKLCVSHLIVNAMEMVAFCIRRGLLGLIWTTTPPHTRKTVTVTVNNSHSLPDSSCWDYRRGHGRRIRLPLIRIAKVIYLNDFLSLSNPSSFYLSNFLSLSSISCFFFPSSPTLLIYNKTIFLLLTSFSLVFSYSLISFSLLLFLSILSLAFLLVSLFYISLCFPTRSFYHYLSYYRSFLRFSNIIKHSPHK